MEEKNFEGNQHKENRNKGCPIRRLSLAFEGGFEGVLRDMARREMSLLSSSSREPAFSRDLLEYLRFQFSRMVALLSFAKTKTEDKTIKSNNNNNNNGATKHASATDCDHGLLCRMISSVVDPIIDREATKLDEFSSSSRKEALADEKSVERKSLNDRCGLKIDRKIQSEKSKKDDESPRNDDPFGLTTNQKATKSSRSRIDESKPRKFSTKPRLPSLEMSFHEKVRHYIDLGSDSVSSASTSSSSIINVVPPGRPSRNATTSSALGNHLHQQSTEKKAVARAMSAASSMPSLQTASSLGDGFSPDGTAGPVVVNNVGNISAAHGDGKAFVRAPASKNGRFANRSRCNVSAEPLAPAIDNFTSGSRGHRTPTGDRKVVSSVGSVATETTPLVDKLLLQSSGRSATSMRLCLDGDLDTTRDESYLRGLISDHCDP